MTAIDYAALVKRLRKPGDQVFSTREKTYIADAIEYIKQPPAAIDYAALVERLDAAINDDAISWGALQSLCGKSSEAIERLTQPGGGDYAALVERARKSIIKGIPSSRVDILLGELADAIERLTQPNGEVAPESIDWPEYHHEGMGCGLEDRCITDRYEAMRYGWDAAIERVAEILPDQSYSAASVARLIAERDAARYELDEAKALAKFLYQRSDEKGTAIAALQDQVKVLREALLSISGWETPDGAIMSGTDACDMAKEALAATEPKEGEKE